MSQQLRWLFLLSLVVLGTLLLRPTVAGAAIPTRADDAPVAASSASLSTMSGFNSGVETPAPLINWAVQVNTDQHTCVLTTSGGVECWGDNTFGQLGDGTTQERAIPTRVVGLPRGVQAVVVGALHTCVLTAAGAVWCWGRNDEGQLGDGTQVPQRPLPSIVAGLSDGWRGLAAGSDHTCALGESGDVKCWGSNYHGQLGDGTRQTRRTPVVVGGLPPDVLALSARGGHTCATTANGRAYCWGYNRQGQLGDGTTVDRSTPVALASPINGISVVSAGGNHTCVLVQGQVQCWGSNSYGQLGDGTTRDRLTPGPVIMLPMTVNNLSAGSGHTCALLADGSAWCWGENSFGQLGDGTTIRRLMPVAVANMEETVNGISVGVQHTCAITTAGGVKCWGANLYGELGDGTLRDHYTPTDVWHFECAQISAVSEAECQALVDFFTATWLLTVQPWDNSIGWLRAPSPCDWYGVTCTGGHITQINLAYNMLLGTLSATLGQLNALQRLDLHGNDLDGPLPATLGNLSALQYLDLSASGLAGAALPPEWGNLSALRYLDLHGNALTGTIPATFGSLTALQTLDLSENTLTGTLPAGLSALTQLRTLDLSDNQLNGTPPTDLGRLVALQTLDLSSNTLTGTLPADLGDAAALRTLDLSANQLNGPLPWTWSRLTALERLDLRHNVLSGELPPEWSLLTALQHLDLSYNALAGWLPPGYDQWAALTHLDLSFNALRGTLPAAWGSLSRLETLSLNNNQLAGPIPAAWGTLGSAGPAGNRVLAASNGR